VSRKRYSEGFKIEAVKQVTDRGHSVDEKPREPQTEYVEIFNAPKKTPLRNNRMRNQERLNFSSPGAFTQKYFANRIAA